MGRWYIRLFLFCFWQKAGFLKKYKLIDIEKQSDKIMFASELFADEQLADEQFDGGQFQ